MDIHCCNNDKANRKEIFILVLCLFIGFGLRFYTFDQKSLWIDEIHTFNDSRDSLKDQIKFYKQEPTYLHPPLFFVLTHLFYPFTKPERDLRIIPLIFGTLSIPMIYFLSRLFSPAIAIPCTLSLTFMTYHVSLSQDGRSYSLLMFLGMAGLYFFMKHLKTSKKRYLLVVAFFFAALFHTSYTSIPFIVISQVLWLYQVAGDNKRPGFSSFAILNGLLVLICLPWVLFMVLNYKGDPIMDPLHTEDPGSFWTGIYWVLHDWVPHAPLMISSAILIILFPLFLKRKKNAVALLTVFFMPIMALYLLCNLFGVKHFVTPRYFIGFMPIFFIALYLSINAIERKYQNVRRFLRLKLLFVILLIASNLVILPLYYRSEKQDLRGLAAYLKGHLEEGDLIFMESLGNFSGIPHYFGIYPDGRYYTGPYVKDSKKGDEYRISFPYRDRTFTIVHSMTCCTQYVEKGRRLWIIVGRSTAKKIQKNTPYVLKGYFDGSVLNYDRFPADASMYLFFWDPQFPEEKGIDVTIE